MATQLTTVFTTFAHVGFHRWPDAPEPVAYLRDRHRHKFNYRVEVSVDGPDREIEYHMLKRRMTDLLWDSYAATGSISDDAEFEFGSSSCEVIAHRVMIVLRSAYPDRSFYSVEVNEDGENGSIVKVLA